MMWANKGENSRR